MREIERKILDIELDFKDTLENDRKQAHNMETQIKDVIYVGDAKWTDRLNGKMVQDKLFIVTKNVLIKNEKGQVIDKKEVKNYYLGDKCIGGFMDVKNPIFNEYFENSEPQKVDAIKNLLDKVSLEELEERSLNTLQKKYMQELSEQLGIPEEEILEMEEVDLDEELPIEQELENKEDENQKVLNSRKLENLDIKEETSLHQEIKGETLGQRLGLEKVGIYGAEKLVRISKSQLSSEDRKGISSSVIDVMAVVRKDGSAVILGDNVLRVNSREGTNPTQENLTLDNNDASIDKEMNTTSYEIVQGNGREYLSIGYDENSGKEIKYSMYSHQEGQYVDVELETNRTFYQDPRVREFLRDRNEGIHEADEILNTYTKDNLDDMSRTILNNSDNGISEVYNQADVKEKIIQKIKEKDYGKDDYDKVIEEVEEEMKESAKGQIVRGDMI